MPLLSLKEKNMIQKKLDTLAGRVKLHFFKESSDCRTCATMEDLLTEVASLSDKIELQTYERRLNSREAEEFKVDKFPAVVVEGPAGKRVRFFGIPGGYEFASFLESLKDGAAGRVDIESETRRSLETVTAPVHIQVFVTPSCPYCTQAVRTAHRLAVEFPNITADMVEVEEFAEVADRYGVSSVPKVVVNNKVEFTGALPEPYFAQAILKAVA